MISALPSGLTFDGLQTISGTPTATGTTVVQLGVSNPFGSNGASLSITIGTPPVLTSGTIVNLATGQSASYLITASGSLPITFGVSGATPLPPGLGFDGNQTISGTPTTLGTYPVTLTATNAFGTTSDTTTFTIGTAPAITSALTIDAALNLPFTYTITGSGSAPLTFSVNSPLPAGLTFDGNQTISGTPTAAGTTVVQLGVSNAFGSQTAGLGITVGSPPIITSPATVTGSTTAPLSYTCTASGTAPITFTLTGNPLPTGLTFDGTTISGTAVANGATQVTVNATNAFGTAIPLSLTIDIGNAPFITSALAVNATLGAPFSYTLTASGSTPLTFSVTSALPAGLTFDGNQTISGTPTAVGTTVVQLGVANALGSGTASLSITVGVPPVFTSASSENLAIGTPASYLITASGATPITFMVTSALPPGLAFDGLQTISGTPTTAGTYAVTGTATNVFGTTVGTTTFTVGTAPTITSALAVNAAINAPFTYAISASGSAPLTFSVNSPLPAGLTFDGNQTISGTPTATGTTTVQLGVSNAFGSGTANLTITVGVPPVITSASSVTASTTTPLGYVCTASGSAPITFTLTGSLPAGLSFNGTTISGTALANGSSQVTVNATNAFGVATPLLLTINIGTAPVITSALTADGAVGLPFSYTITASGTTPIAFTTSQLPAGLSFDGVATISGTPTATGQTSVTLGASNFIGGASPATLLINIQTGPAISSALTANAMVGVPFQYQITATGSPTITLGETTALPAGLTFDGVSLISGTPIASGTFPITLTATSPFATAAATLQLVIAAAVPPTITSPLAVMASNGQPFSYLITATGTPTITFTVSGLPTGLTFDGNQTISGTPTVDGVSTITITATNPGGSSGPQSLILTVTTHPVITSAAATSGTQGSRFNFALTASGTAPISFTTSALPSGLVLTGATITGTPLVAGTFPITVTASNVGGTSAPQTLTITIAAANAPVITSALGITGTAGLPLTYIITAVGTAPIAFTTSALPAGLTRAGAYISGTVAAGTYTVTLTATNAGGQDVESLLITINAPVAPAITSALSASGTTGIPFSYAIQASGTAPVSLGVTSALPAGLSFDGASIISGTPTAVGVTQVTLTATNAVGQTIQATLQITIAAPVAPAITSSLSVNATTNTAFSYTITASGTTPIALTAAPLPPGLTFDGTQTISGTPTTAGVYDVTLGATNSAGTATPQTLVITVVNPLAAVITSPATATATQGASFSYTITASGSTPIAFGAQGMPAWMSLNGAVLSGVPTAAGTITVTLIASNAAGSATPVPLAITVAPAVAPVITSTAPTTVAEGTAFSYLIQASGTPNITFTAVPLPAGWSLSPTIIAGAVSEATLSGTLPATPGQLAIQLTATNAGGSGSQALDLAIIPPSPTLTQLTPDGGPISGGTSVTFTGTDLAGATSVTFDGLAATITADTDTSLVVTTPAHAASGFVTVVITTPGGTTTATSAYGYIPLPDVIDITPNNGVTTGGATITIVGSNLAGLAGLTDFLTITFGGLPAQIVSVNDAEITIAIPAHAAGAVDVVISSLAGTLTIPNGFTYVGPGGTTTTGGTTAAGGTGTGTTPASGSSCGLGAGGLSLMLGFWLLRRRSRVG